MKSGLLAGDLDLILTVPEDEEVAGIRWEPVERRSWRVALAATHPLAGNPVIAIDDLADQRWLMFRKSEYPDYWRRVRDYCHQHGLKPKVVGEFDGFSSLATAVESGMGIALVADGSGAGDRQRMQMLRIEPQPEPICVAVGSSAAKDLEGPEKVLIEELRRVAQSR